MRAFRGAVAALLVLAAGGCAKNADWIGGTLVTVDVSGLWRGQYAPEWGVGSALEMSLVQRGARVIGEGHLRGTRVRIEGAVRGDVFSFTEPGGRLRGEATVTGDEMAGQGWTSISPPLTTKFKLNLSRQP